MDTFLYVSIATNLAAGILGGLVVALVTSKSLIKKGQENTQHIITLLKEQTQQNRDEHKEMLGALHSIGDKMDTMIKEQKDKWS